eukprot:Hpha_TRINITY_DN15243_c2_g3::TRINITY_DN15243_c2_g3_i1::g.65956::m.65956/K16051/tesI; 3-oxo-5alpha-steroid 4-dehydrogenase
MPTFIGRFLYANTGIMGLGAGLTAGPIVVGVLAIFFTLLLKEATRLYMASAFGAYVVYLFIYAKSVGGRRRGRSVGGSTEFDETFDLVVVGYGGAGAAAALEAAKRGLKVLVIERFGGGGATTRSGGVFYAGGGTALQHKLGVEDSPDNMFRYLKEEMAGTVPDEELRVFSEASRGDVEFLLENGVRVGVTEGSKLFDFHKTSHPPNGFSLYYSGSEQAAPFCQKATPAQRGHLAVGNDEMPGSAVGTGCVMFGGMQRACEKNSKHITVRIQTACTRLIIDNGKVTGVETRTMDDTAPWGLQLLAELAEALGSCMKPPQLKPCDAFAQWTIRNIEAIYGQARLVGAKKGVVIAAGGFGANLSMVREHCPQYTGCMPLGTLGDDGSGIKLGLQAGAQLTGMDRGSAWKFTYPPEAFLKTVQVGMDGERLGNEDVYGARLTANMTSAGGNAWLIMDQKLWNEAKAEVSTSKTMVVFQKAFGWMNLYMNRKKGKTLGELAKQCGLPEGNLRKTIVQYNDGCRKGVDPKFNKNKRFLSSLESEPYYAIHFAAANTLWMTPFLTLGGLKVDFSTGLVLDKQGQKIPGLYAAGRSASGIPAVSYVSGLSIADCVFSGRRAARHASGEASGLPQETLHLYKR